MDFLSDIIAQIARLGPGVAETAGAVWAHVHAVDPERIALITSGFIAFFALRFLRPIAAGIIGSSRAPENGVRHVLARLVSGIWSLFLLAAVFAALGPFLGLGEATANVLQSAVLILGAIQGAIWARELLVSVVIGYAAEHSTDGSALSNASNVLKVLVGT
ncbi:MAG: hypothetical protein AAFV51_14135, partial [Pseudomonadota bacterium]